MNFWARAAIAAIWMGGYSTASATDLVLLSPPPELEVTPVTVWTGPYVGVHAGGAWGNVDITDVYEFPIDPTVKSNLRNTGGIGGVQVGYNIQRGKFIYGIEGDLGYLGLSESKTTTLQHNLNATYELSGGLYGDLAGRLGYTANNTLFYLKGGAAFLDMGYDSHYRGSSGGGTQRYDFNHSETMWGWTLGAGIEHKLSSSLSLKAEYQHFDFGSTSFEHVNARPNNGGWTQLTTNADVAVTVDAVTVGLNYNLSGSRESLR